MHHVLERLLKRLSLDPASLPKEILPLLDRISESYDQHDEERARLERSMMISSQELLTANEELRSVFRMIPDIFLRIKSDGVILDCRSGAFDQYPFFSLSEELVHPSDGENEDINRFQFTGKRIKDVTDPRVMIHIERGLSQIFKQNDVIIVEFAFSKVSPTLYFEARFFPPNEDECLLIIRNISQRKAAEREILRQRAFLRQVIDVNPNFIYAKDREGRFTLVNRAFSELIGVASEDLIGKTPEEVNYTQSIETATAEKDVFETNSLHFYPEEIVYDANQKPRIVQSVRRPILSQDGSVTQLLSVSTDITARKEAESENELLTKQLLQSQKLQAMGTLAGGVAHDFNNLLSSITGFSSLMRLTLSQETLTSESIEELVSYLDLIDQASLRGAKMIKQILGFSRQGKINVKPTEVIPLIQEVIRLIQHTIDKRITIETDFASNQYVIDADESQIVQVVINLAVNAVDAMIETLPQKHSGTLLFSLCVVANSKLPPGLPQKHRTERYVRIDIKDTGIGIKEDMKNRLFEPFFTTKPPDKGSGLGLAMSYGIVKNHNGFIWVDSTFGKGTVVSLFFPQSEVISTVQHEQQSPFTPSSGKGSILVVDDEPALRLLLTRGLGKVGYSVTSAVNGKDALTMYEADPSKFDAIVLDMNMPIMNGMDTFYAIRTLKPQAKILFVTGHLSDSNAEALKGEPFTIITTKPYAIGEISQLLEKLLKLS